MAMDGLLPPALAQVHPQYKSPYLATIGSGIVALMFAGCLSLEVLANLVAIGTLLAFTIVSIAVLILRWREPDLERPFRVPLMPWIPLLGATASIVQMLSFSPANWFRLLGWLLIGLVIYFFYGQSGSRMHEHPQPSVSISNIDENSLENLK